MEDMVMFSNVYHNRVVWISGHTGFKGAWLSEWLLSLGAKVYGFALPPPTKPALFDQLGLGDRVHHQIGDVRNAEEVKQSLCDCHPDFVFHLAAQPIVRLAYEIPIDTYAINVLGTIHVLQALRNLEKRCAAVFITTDKCYENQEWIYGYREQDPLGGHDPYSSSKAAAEIAISSFRRSFFNPHPVRIASARAGNVIGGGDWAIDRIVPDCIRALRKCHPIAVRNPHASRPWQHVLEPLSGYLSLAAQLDIAEEHSPCLTRLCSPFNFGPGWEANRSVGELVNEILQHWSGRWEDKSDPQAVHEARCLHLSIDKACTLLGWAPVWEFTEAVANTMTWYRQAEKMEDPTSLRELTQNQIKQYADRALASRVSWTQDQSKSQSAIDVANIA